MIIDEEKCVGCGACVPYCTVNAIILEGGKARIDESRCVECYTCFRSWVCPEGAIRMTPLEWPREIRNTFSDVVCTHKVTGIPGRGTEEMKTNDITGRYSWGEVGFCVELGRPGVGTRFKEAEKVSIVLAGKGVEFEKQNPYTHLIDESGKLRFNIGEERVLSCLIEFRTKLENVPEILRTLRNLESEVETVFTVGVISRFNPDGSIPVLSLIEGEGFKVRPNAKINLGLGKRLGGDP
ncbi:MAG: 4Fe-4S binding protein [Candidatus Jordarchaeaceae archaeon]